jgi:hypothetical protein
MDLLRSAFTNATDPAMLRISESLSPQLAVECRETSQWQLGRGNPPPCQDVWRTCGAWLRSRSSPPGYVRYTISVNGQRASSADAPDGKPVFYLVSPQFFVMAWDEATSAALQRGLGVGPAHC